MSNITVTELQGHTSGGDANTVKVKSGHTLAAQSNATVGGTLGVTGTTTTAQINASGSINTTANTISVTNSSYPQLQLNSGVKNYHIFNDTGGNSLYFKNATDNVNGMIMDSSGRVTKPAQPAFSTYGTAGNVSFQAEATITAWNTMIFNEGNHFDTSTGKFTAPVNGKYFFRAQLYMQNSTGVCRLRLYKNTSVAVYHYYASTITPGPGNIQGFLSLAANDTVELKFNADNTTNVYFADNHSNFDGWLVL